MRLLAAFILVVTLAGLPSCKFLQNKVFGKKARALAELKARQDSIRVADSIKNVQERLLALENARLDSIRQAEEMRKAGEFKYNIIVGSFITPEYAKGLAEEYSKHGYTTQIIPLAGTKFELVAAEGHKSLKNAIKRLAAFQDTVQVDSWIYIR
jgi:hypothetical protein